MLQFFPRRSTKPQPRLQLQQDAKKSIHRGLIHPVYRVIVLCLEIVQTKHTCKCKLFLFHSWYYKRLFLSAYGPLKILSNVLCLLSVTRTVDPLSRPHLEPPAVRKVLVLHVFDEVDNCSLNHQFLFIKDRLFAYVFICTYKHNEQTVGEQLLTINDGIHGLVFRCPNPYNLKSIMLVCITKSLRLS